MLEPEIFSAIPMRTWRWLGVNEAKYPENIDSSVNKQKITVEENEIKDLVIVNRTAGQYELEIEVAKNAKINLVQVQLIPEDAPYTSRVTVNVADGGLFSYTAVETGAKHTASELTVNLNGKESIADIWSLYFGTGSSKIDLNYIIRQKGRQTDANMQVRGALLGSAEKIFRGTLDFIEGAKGSVGREDEEVVLLSPTVRNRSVPIMLSHEDDVDGHHAVSVGRMDENKLFYLMSRGLDIAEAQKLIVEASFNPVLDRIGDENLRREIDTYLQERLANG